MRKIGRASVGSHPDVPKLPISVSRASSPVANGQFGAACRGISHCRPGVLSADSIKAPLSAAENDTKLPVCDGKPAMPGGNGEFGVTGCSYPATRSSFLRCTAFLTDLAALPRRLPDRARLVPSVFPTDLASSRVPSRPSSPRLARRQLPAEPPPLEPRRPSPRRLPSRIHRGLRGISSSRSLPSRPPTDWEVAHPTWGAIFR